MSKELGDKKISKWDTSWTKSNYDITEEFIRQLYSVLDERIQDSGGKWKGTYQELREIMGLDDSWYGTIFNALPTIRERYGITSKSAGRSGNEYFYVVTTEERVDNYKEVLDEIKFIINSIDESKTDTKDLLNAVKIIRRICNEIK